MERTTLQRKFQTALLDEKIESLKKTGKPFYWTDSDKLRKLKRLCESQKDETVRQRALTALYEYHDVIEKYNYLSKNKITDIFPRTQKSIESSISGQKNISVMKGGPDIVNVSYIDNSTISANNNDLHPTG